MGLTFDGAIPDEITYDGQPVDSVTYNGVEVWNKSIIKTLILPYSGNIATALAQFYYITPNHFIFGNTSKDTITIVDKSQGAITTKSPSDFGFIDNYGSLSRNRTYTGYRISANADNNLLKFDVMKVDDNTLTESAYDTQLTNIPSTGLSVSISPIKNTSKCIIFVSNTSTLLFKNLVYDAENKTLNEIIFEGLPGTLDLSTTKFESVQVFSLTDMTFTVIPTGSYTRLSLTRIQGVESTYQRYYANVKIEGNKFIFENFDPIVTVSGSFAENIRSSLINVNDGTMPYIDLGIGSEDLKIYGTKFKNFNAGVYTVETELLKATPSLLTASGTASMSGYGDGVFDYLIHSTNPFTAQAFYVA